MDSKINNNPINIFIENNSINEELELKWKEIEQKTKQKINKTHESKKLNNLNDFSIMRIDLSSLIHPIDDSSEFEDYCQLKVNQLEKIKQSFGYSQNYNMNLLTFGFNKPDNTNNSSLKSFLKEDNENDLFIKKNEKYTLNDLIEINKNKNLKKKLDIKNLLDLMDNNDNNDNQNYSPNSIENRNNKGNQSDNNIINKINDILSQKKFTFLKPNNERVVEPKNNFFSITQKNKPSYLKNSFDNKIGINSKIKDNYNYLYSLYPNIKRKYNNIN